jgi:CheY-like chemotaxis protein
VAPGPYETLQVDDNGRGMDAEVLARSTEPLFTTKPEGLGTGLGLSMVRRAVEESDGFLSITSRPGLGTSVVLGFPTAERPVVALGAAPRGVSADTQRPARVLLVDDEPTVLSATCALPEALGCDVTCARTPEEARAEVARGAVDLLVTDISLGPTMNGVELARAVRAQLPELPVLFITGFATGPVLEGAQALGPVLWKPFGVDALRRTVRGLLGDGP